ncbi:MAG: nascent polypeptide-associated complex protein [Euryarchaeota archaeon]|nr:nascent polypeptide-associated complex protein [Euryarchaeota archaeon]
MMPGMPRGMNPKQLNQMMKTMGISVKNIDNVKKIIIQTDTKEYVFDNAEVTVMEVKGEKTYQIVGAPKIKDITAAKKEDTMKDDVKLIMDQTGKTEAEARKALQETGGDLAEAILKLTG